MIWESERFKTINSSKLCLIYSKQTKTCQFAVMMLQWWAETDLISLWGFYHGKVCWTTLLCGAVCLVLSSFLEKSHFWALLSSDRSLRYCKLQQKSAVFQMVLLSLIATTAAMLSFPHCELVGIHRGAKCGLLKSDHGAITVWYSVRKKVGI